MDTTILILGGYGNAGRLIAKYVLKETGARVVVGGRNPERASVLASSLSAVFGSERVAARRVDASDRSSLDEAFLEADMVVVASSSSPHVQNVAEAAIAAGIDYLDLQFSTQKLRVLRRLEEEINRAECCFITDGGFHPGLPAALARYACQHMNNVERVRIGGVINVDWGQYQFSPETVQEMVDEITEYNASVYCNGSWKKAGWKDRQRFDFGDEIGCLDCYPMMLEELAQLPGEIPTLKELGFYIAGFNWFVDLLVLPVGFMVKKLNMKQGDRFIGRLLVWGLKTFSNPPFKTILQMDANGKAENKEQTLTVTLEHEDPYVMTALPVVACLLQYLGGNIRRPGLWLQAHIVEPVIFLRDIERLGISVDVEVSSSSS